MKAGATKRQPNPEKLYKKQKDKKMVRKWLIKPIKSNEWSTLSEIYGNNTYQYEYTSLNLE